MEEAPLELYRTAVEPGWIDYNGHMNLAYYVLVFDRGTDALLDRLGLGADYRRETGSTLYVVEAHLTYDREVKEGEEVVVSTRLLGADEKRLHLIHVMRRADGALAATNELLFLHVDAAPRAASIPEAGRSAIAALVDEHARLPVPKQAGRRIALRRTAP
jgi:acyl-CoA thioester hydrolase